MKFQKSKPEVICQYIYSSGKNSAPHIHVPRIRVYEIPSIPRNSTYRYHFFNFSVADFQKFFSTVSEEKILSNYELFSLENFRTYARTLSCYNEFMLFLETKIRNDKKIRQKTAFVPGFDYHFGFRGEKSGFHDFIFAQTSEIRKMQSQKNNDVIQIPMQVSHVADTFKNAVETRLVENISELSAQIQDLALQTSEVNNAQSPIQVDQVVAQEVSNEQLQKNVVLPQKVLHVHETHVMNQLEQDWLSQKDTAYNSARLEERLDALNKVKVTQGLELDELLHKELAESCSRMQELSRDFGHDRHVQMLSPFVHLRADQAARESNPIVAFELSDFCDMTTKALEHGMHVLYDAGCAVDRGIVSGIKHAFSIEHWKDMAMGSVQMGLSCAKVVVLDDLEKYCAAIIDLVPGSHAMKQLEERNQLQTQAQIKSAFEVMSKTHDTLEKMSWQEIVENGSAIGTTMILDTLVFHAAGEFASATSNTFMKELAKVTESGQLFTQEYLVEVAGVGKIAIEEGLETTATMFESMNGADSLTKNISKLSEAEILVPSEGTIVKNTEGAAETMANLFEDTKDITSLTKNTSKSESIPNAPKISNAPKPKKENLPSKSHKKMQTSKEFNTNQTEISNVATKTDASTVTPKSLEELTGITRELIANRPADLLDIMETMGGHTLEKHVSKSYDYLKKRTTKIKRGSATSFTNKLTALKAVQENLQKNCEEVISWLSDASRMELVCEVSHSYPIGKGVFKAKNNPYYDLNSSRMVLRKNNQSPFGFIIVTAFPV